MDATKPVLLLLMVIISTSCQANVFWDWTQSICSPTMPKSKSSSQGKYFPKKSYIPASLPEFEKVKILLPEPILPAKPEWIEMYWKAWQLAFTKMKVPPKGSPLVSNYLDEGFSDHLFQWDTFFMILFADYAHHLFPAIESLDNFYSRQYENGFIDREIIEESGEGCVFGGIKNAINPPLFAWVEWEHFKLTGDDSRFEKVYLPLVRYARYLEEARSDSRTGLYWNTNLASGMDNMARKGSAWVDMSSQMVLMYRGLQKISLYLNKNVQALDYGNKADAIALLVNKKMWDESEGLYFDLDKNGKQVKRKTIASFWPMVAGIPGREQARKMMGELKNPKTFWRNNIWPALAADEKGYSSLGNYWKGGVWAPTNAMVMKGLTRFENYELANESAGKYLDMLASVYEKTGTLWEYYSPEKAIPGIRLGVIEAKEGFVGWSGLGPIRMLIENVIGIELDVPEKEIHWRLFSLSDHGVRNLHFGKQNLDLELRGNIIFTKLDGDEIITLNITYKNQFKMIKIHPGTHQYKEVLP